MKVRDLGSLTAKLSSDYLGFSEEDAARAEPQSSPSSARNSHRHHPDARSLSHTLLDVGQDPDGSTHFGEVEAQRTSEQESTS